MIKTIRIVAIIVTIVSALILCNSTYHLVQMQNAEKADCTITFIGLPDGTVFGDFTDSDGVVHINEALYTSSFLQIFNTNAEHCCGTQITILYDPHSGRIINYDHTIRILSISAALMVLSALWLVSVSCESKKQNP